MIIARITGGLGNQMFQYANSRALAMRNRTNLYLDISSYTSDYHKSAPRTFKLAQFNIQANIAQSENFKSLGIPNSLDQRITTKISRTLYKIIEKLKPLHKRKYIIEETYNFSPKVYEVGPNCFLSGVWQSPKYFEDIDSIIRSELTLKHPPSNETQEWIKMIEATNSVSLHIRRGDYITNEKTNIFHGTCSVEYYERSMNLMASIISPIFFVFSDDIEWARKNLKTIYPINFVSNKNIPDYEELIIMSKCKHNIIANSTFSWWGSWLNENKNKIIIAPKKWFTVNNFRTDDLIPKDWITI